MKLSGPGPLFGGMFLITVLILLVIHLVIHFNFSLFIFAFIYLRLLFLIFLQFGSLTQSCLTLCDLMDCRTAGFPVHHQLPELAQTLNTNFQSCITNSWSLFSLERLTKGSPIYLFKERTISLTNHFYCLFSLFHIFLLWSLLCLSFYWLWDSFFFFPSSCSCN